MATLSFNESFNTNKNLRPTIKKKLELDKPIIIFTSGPTGSGKSTLLKKTLNTLYKTKSTDDIQFKQFLIDDYVENSIEYKEKIKDIIEQYGCREPIQPTCDLINPSNDLLQSFSDAYFTVRNNGPCTNSNSNSNNINEMKSIDEENDFDNVEYLECKQLEDSEDNDFDNVEYLEGKQLEDSEDNDYRSCKQKMLDDINNAILNNENILIETTGKKLPLDYLIMISELKNLNEYNIIFSYALVNFYKLLDRNKLRSLKQMKLFNNSNYLTPAPRLPNISIGEFKETTKNIERMLVLLRNVCLRRGRPPVDKCGIINSNPNNILLIFDNDDIKSKLIYNSLTNDKFMSEQEFITLLTIYMLSKNIEQDMDVAGLINLIKKNKSKKSKSKKSKSKSKKSKSIKIKSKKSKKSKNVK